MTLSFGVLFSVTELIENWHSDSTVAEEIFEPRQALRVSLELRLARISFVIYQSHTYYGNKCKFN